MHRSFLSIKLAIRVTRLDDFSPIGRLFTLGSFFEKYKSGPNFGAAFFNGRSCVLILTKKWIGLHFGQFFNKHIWSPCLQSKLHLHFDYLGLFACYLKIILEEKSNHHTRK
jgi:hypothetical protein